MPPTPDITTPAPTPKRSKTKLWIIIAVIIGLLIIGLLLVLILWPKSPQKPIQSSTEAKEQQANALLGNVYTSGQYKVSVRFPKGWTQAEKSLVNPYSVVKYQNPQVDTEGPASGQANAELSARPADESLEDYTRRIIETMINLDVTSKLIDNKNIAVNGKAVRLISYEIPSKSGIKGRITQFIFIKNERFYDLSFTVLSSKWDAYKDAVAASASSLKIE